MSDFNLDEAYKDYKIYEAVDLISPRMSSLFLPNDKLVLEIVSGAVYEGDVARCGWDRMDLFNVRKVPDGSTLSGIYSFYKMEVRRARVFKYIAQEQGEGTTEKQNAHIKLEKTEYNRLNKMSKEYIFIQEMSTANEEFCYFLEQMKKAEQIGLSAPGLYKKSLPIPILAISTWQEVFIFDTLVVPRSQFTAYMKEILESENICKVVHRGAPLIEMIKSYYDIYTKYVFDIEVVDIILRNKENPNETNMHARTISQCLVVYFNFPPLMEDAEQVKHRKWSKRPLKSSKLFYASQLVTYLIILKEYLHQKLTSNVHLTLDNFYEYCNKLSASSYDYTCFIKSKKVTEDLKDIFVDSDQSD